MKQQLLRARVSLRFVSYEPALGPVDFDAISITVAPGFFGSPLGWHHRGRCHEMDGIPYPKLDWIIVGGESGPGARPFYVDWARQTVNQCKAAGVACFVKQLGSYVIQDGEHRKKADRKGGDWHEWPHDIRVREFPGDRQRQAPATEDTPEANEKAPSVLS